MIDTEIKELTRRLVEIGSVNGSSGEKDIGVFLEKYFRDMPYYQKHPDYLFVVPIPGDKLERRSVIALLRGEKDDNRKTLILHGHTDTVGLEGYGSLEPYALNPDELEKRLPSVELPDAVKKDLESGDFMFGRGSCDMKSGDAVFITLLKRLSEHPEDFSGNLIVSLNPVEENMHTGVITSLPTLLEIQQRYDLEFVAALNNDFTAPLYPGDEKKTIYTGIGGKVLPCFYIQGKETHVGQCFEGFDASMLAAELVRTISLSMDFEDTYGGETAYPPSVLKMKDLKSWYNVQTAKDAFVYFNYFVHDASVDHITELLLRAAEKAFRSVADTINIEFSRFCVASGETYHPYSYETRVMTYSQLLALAKEHTPDEIDAHLTQIIAEENAKGTDIRETAIPMIRYLLSEAGMTEPTVVLYYAPPYCPHSTLKEGEQEVIDVLHRAADETTEETGTQYRFMKFYPSLSDSSYFRIDDDENSIRTLVENFPAFKENYDLPIDAIRQLQIPAVNIGCYGADCHKWSERVYMPYTFDVLPKLEMKLIRYLLEAD